MDESISSTLALLRTSTAAAMRPARWTERRSIAPSRYVRLSHDGQTLAVCVGDSIALFDAAKVQTNAAGALLGLAPTHSVKKTTIDVVLSADDRFVFTTLEYDRQVAVIDRATRAFVGAVPIEGDAITGPTTRPRSSPTSTRRP